MTVAHDVTIVSPLNLPPRCPSTPRRSTRATSRRCSSCCSTSDGELALDFDDEIVAGACVVRDGEIVNAAARERRARPSALMLLTNLTILVLAGFVGFAVISKVPEHAAHAADVRHQRDPRHRRCSAACS